VVGASVIPIIPPHLPISFFYINIKMKSCQENKILTDSSSNESSLSVIAWRVFTVTSRNCAALETASPSGGFKPAA
jgi:hypothetical protein